MVKLVAIYKKPENVEEFDKYYFEVHSKLADKMPGLIKIEVAKITSAVIGEAPHHLITEMYFNSKTDLDFALASPEGRAAGKDLMSFAAKYVSLFTTEII